ncbi:hypothetical protein M8C21_027874, partial [Ambrosia artemisiifolia]
MATTTTTTAVDPDPSLRPNSIPTIDLRLLSQSDLHSLSNSSSSHLHRCDDVVIPKIDRSVFNESAGSRKQTYSRLRLAPPSISSSPSPSPSIHRRMPRIRPSHTQTPLVLTDHDHADNSLIITAFNQLFNLDSNHLHSNSPLQSLNPTLPDLLISPVQSLNPESPVSLMNPEAPAQLSNPQVPDLLNTEASHLLDPGPPESLDTEAPELLDTEAPELLNTEAPAELVNTEAPAEILNTAMKRKRGRPRKNEHAVVVRAPEPKRMRHSTVKKEVVYDDDKDREIVNSRGVKVNLLDLGRLEDPYGEEIRRRTQGLSTADELLGFLRGLNGQWGTTRKKRRVVDASDFGDALPKGWRLSLCIKRKEGRVWVYCRRYISPSGRQFESCKDISMHLLSLLGEENMDEPNHTHSNNRDELLNTDAVVELLNPESPAELLNTEAPELLNTQASELLDPGASELLDTEPPELLDKKAPELLSPEAPELLNTAMKRKRGRPRKNENAVVVCASAEKRMHQSTVKKVVVYDDDRDREVVNSKGVKVNLMDLGRLEDPYGEEIRRRTEDTKAYEGITNVTSPGGRQFESCKDISTYLLSLLGEENMDIPNYTHSNNGDDSALKGSSGNHELNRDSAYVIMAAANLYAQEDLERNSNIHNPPTSPKSLPTDCETHTYGIVPPIDSHVDETFHEINQYNGHIGTHVTDENKTAERTVDFEMVSAEADHKISFVTESNMIDEVVHDLDMNEDVLVEESGDGIGSKCSNDNNVPETDKAPDVSISVSVSQPECDRDQDIVGRSNDQDSGSEDRVQSSSICEEKGFEANINDAHVYSSFDMLTTEKGKAVYNKSSNGQDAVSETRAHTSSICEEKGYRENVNDMHMSTSFDEFTSEKGKVVNNESSSGVFHGITYGQDAVSEARSQTKGFRENINETRISSPYEALTSETGKVVNKDPSSVVFHGIAYGQDADAEARAKTKDFPQNINDTHISSPYGRTWGDFKSDDFRNSEGKKFMMGSGSNEMWKTAQGNHPQSGLETTQGNHLQSGLVNSHAQIQSPNFHSFDIMSQKAQDGIFRQAERYNPSRAEPVEFRFLNDRSEHNPHALQSGSRAFPYNYNTGIEQGFDSTFWMGKNAMMPNMSGRNCWNFWASQHVVAWSAFRPLFSGQVNMLQHSQQEFWH